MAHRPGTTRRARTNGETGIMMQRVRCFWSITFLEVPDEMTIESEVDAFLLASTGAASPRAFIAMKQKENNISPPLGCARVLGARACFGD